MKDVIHNEISEKTSVDRKESLTMTESNVERIVANMLGDLAARYAAKPESPAETTPEKKGRNALYKRVQSAYSWVE